MMGIAACWVAVALAIEQASAAAALRSRSLDMACFSNADNRLMAPSKEPKNPPLFDLEEEAGAFTDEGTGGVGAEMSPMSFVFEGVDGVAGVLTAAASAAAAVTEAIWGVTTAKKMRQQKSIWRALPYWLSAAPES